MSAQSFLSSGLSSAAVPINSFATTPFAKPKRRRIFTRSRCWTTLQSSHPARRPFRTFSYPSATSSGVDDSIDGGLDFRFSPSRLTSWGLGSNGRRLNKQNLTIVPISDPRKLELMRCVYQQAVGYHSGFEATGECPSCDLRLANFYFGSPTPEKLVATTDSGVPITARKDLDGRPYGGDRDRTR